MTSRWLRRSRTPTYDEHIQSAQASLTAAFLDLENRLDVAESAFQAAHALAPQPTLEREWDGVRNACYEATAAYLAATGPVGEPPTRNNNSAEWMTSLRRAQQLLDTARRGLDQFYERHRATLDKAAARAVAVATEADTALAVASDVQRQLAATDQRLLSYPSVQRARDRLDASRTDLQLARERRDLAAVSAGTARLTGAVATLAGALKEAPQREEQARRTVSSIRTRLDALRNRSASIGTTMSELLREFHAGSSADLADNQKASQVHIARADALLKQAVAAHAEHRPEAALELAAESRAQLSDAEHLVDAVTDRLALLRQLRRDPRDLERRVRFRLRDAQRLAVARGAEKEWGSALDAQGPRIDRIVAGLSSRHPDYWSYHLALEDVSQFIATIVARIRSQSAV